MGYYNQYNYKSVPYPSATRPSATVSSSGCGVCCMCMVVEGLTGEDAPPSMMAQYSISVGARSADGTDMRRLGQAAADRWGLTYRTSDDIGDVIEAVKRGGMVIANVGGDRSGYKGLFSNGGHYVVVVGETSGKLIVWDSGQYEGKYSTLARIDKVQGVGHDIRVLPAYLDQDCSNRQPRYYIFEREDSMTQADFDRMMDNWLARRAELPASAWAVNELAEAVALGITDGQRPRSFATREEVAAMIVRVLSGEEER